MSNKFGTVSKASCFRRCWSETMTACSQTLCMIRQVTKGAHRTVKSLVLSAWLMKGASMWVCKEDHDNRLSSFVEVYMLLHSVRVQVCVSFELCDVLQLLWAWGSVADCWNIVQRSTLTGHSDVLLVRFLFLHVRRYLLLLGQEQMGRVLVLYWRRSDKNPLVTCWYQYMGWTCLLMSALTLAG
jgi:hypothetical protein